MNKNRNFLKFLLVALVGVGITFSVSQAVTLKVDYNALGYTSSSNRLDTGNVSPIHFADNENNFGGFFYFTDMSGEGSKAQAWTGDVEPLCECEETDRGEVKQKLSCKTNEGVEYSCDENDHRILYEPAQFQVKAGEDTYECRAQVKGFYYNSQRGERLWPLDEETKKAWNLTGLDFTGGIYTRCSKAGYKDALEQCISDGDCDMDDGIKKLQEKYYDEHSFYGMITHEYQGEKWQLIMGVNYSKPSSSPWIEINWNDLKFSSTFQRLGNKFPVGFIYDYNGGLGFVGCKVTDSSVLTGLLDAIDDNGTIQDIRDFYHPEAETRENMIKYDGLDCSNVGSTADSLLRLVVDGLVGMGTNTDAAGIMGNTTSTKMQYFSSVNVNNAELINFAKQKAEALCRGKWKSSDACNENLCCLSFNSRTPVTPLKNKTYIVKNGDVQVSPIDEATDTDYYDIFIDGGDLVINESDKKFVIGRNGFIDGGIVLADFNSDVDEVFVDTGVSIYNGTGVAVASVLRGNFIVNGDVKNKNNNGELGNKYFVYGKFTTKRSYDDLKKTFTRKCNAGIGTDGNRCPKYAPESPYQGAFLVVVDQNYNSPLFW